MIRRSAVAAALVLLVSLALAGAAQARLPQGFFGIAPQTPLRVADTNRMRHGGLETIRVPVNWGSIQSGPRAAYDWSGMDDLVALASRSRMDLLPFVSGTPRWLAGRESALPVRNARQRRAWFSFVHAIVARYGSRGSFWREHAPGSGDFVPRNPITRWQIWNEPNYHFFAFPVSPRNFARLLKITKPAVGRADPRSEIVLGGLFGSPRPRPPRGMDSAAFLNALYRVPGIKATFDGIALHPYTGRPRDVRLLAWRLRRVALRNGDHRAGLYVTEMGWGSDRDPAVSFEVGWRPQARELRRAYRLLLGDQRRLNLKQVHWFTWKDTLGLCNFCDSVGLFRNVPNYRPKPAWYSLVRIARGNRR